MAWDLALSDTGDLIFGPNRDLLGVSGQELDKQRIVVRCRIPRGSFIYDEDETLGSNLHTISRYTSARQLSLAEAYVQEALADMEGVDVEEVEAALTDEGYVGIRVKFTQTDQLDADARLDDTNEEDDVVEFDATAMFSEQE